MLIRITSPSVKIGYVVIGALFGLLLSVAVALTIGLPFAALVWGAFLIGHVLFAARTFRGETELLKPPRPWWKLTSKPTAGFIFGSLFIVQAVVTSTSLAGSNETVTAWALVLNALIGVLFLNSSIRLRRTGVGAAAH